MEPMEVLPPLHTSHCRELFFTGSSTLAPIFTFLMITVVPTLFIPLAILVSYTLNDALANDE